MNGTTTGSILDDIVARTRSDLTQRKSSAPRDTLERRCLERDIPIRLSEQLTQQDMAVIAEIKRASPSRGVFPIDVNPPVVAAEYIAGGAAAISVLTNEPYFRGSLDDLQAAAAVAHRGEQPIPVLRKDFIVDLYQVVEARAHGADAILLIVAVLDDATLAALLAEADRRGMDALVEVHDEGEMQRAAHAGARVIGINNRDLRTFTVDLAVTERLAPLAPPGSVVVAESGIFDAGDVRRLARAGARAVLVGEGLILAADRPAAVRELSSCSDRP
jgi:indole-3-glycerol phosphate synthase